jgi:phospholipid/cholesterol/gamma-HCH transport system substrate-binding protein
MLTRATLTKVAVFTLIAVLVMGYTAFRYANLGRLLGLRGYYVVKLELASAGGIFPQADVTYRGVSVGRVGAVRLTGTGVEADLDISDSAPRIPADLRASVADLSAVGEEYVELRPDSGHGPYLAQGSVIPARDTQLPLPVTTLLTSVNSLATSVPLGSLRAVLNALATGLGGTGTSVADLINGQTRFIRAAGGALPQTDTLIEDGQTVLATQNAEAAAFESFAASARLFQGQLAASDSDLRRLIATGAPASVQVAGLITDNAPTLGALIANLLTTSEVTLTRGPALEETFSALPAAIAAGSTVITSKGARFGVALTFFSPLPCTAGYQGTIVRNGLDTSPGPPLNTSAQCTEPPGTGIDVRGSANAPPGGGVPPAARPGLAGLLGLSP